MAPKFNTCALDGAEQESIKILTSFFNTYYIDMRYILTVAYRGINSGEIGRYLIGVRHHVDFVVFYH